MGAIWIIDAADVLRAAGLTVVETGASMGWQSRARSSGGFDAQPLGVLWHHTASSTSPESDLSWMINGSDDAPIGNAYIARDGRVYMVAAGAANTAGKGGPLTFSRGTVPKDKGNTTTWNFEVANNGVGEPWPVVQMDAYFAASNAMNARFGNQPTDLATHNGYCEGSCPGRKIDPARADVVQGAWKPGSVNSSGSWNQTDIRNEAAKRAGSTPPPSGGGTYTVVAGDSWWAISQRYGITVDELVALNPPATSATVIHPGDVLNVPGGSTPPPPAQTAPNGLTAAENQAAGAKAATPPSSPEIRNTTVHTNAPWLQQVLCSLPTLPADGGRPIFPPEWVGEGRVGNEPAVFRKFGDGGRDALAYWQSKNGLTADGVYGPKTEQKMRAARGR